MATATVPNHDQAFREERLSGIGGSDIHQLLNEPEFGRGCRRLLMYEKLGIPADQPRNIDPGILKRGKKMEALIAEEYTEATGRELRRYPRKLDPVLGREPAEGMARHPEYPWAITHIDRMILNGSGIGDYQVSDTGELEIKSFDPWAFKKMVQNQTVRGATALQIQHGMFVTGYKYGAFAGMNVSDFDLRHFDVPRDEGMIEIIKREGESFWNAREKALTSGDNPIPQLEDEYDLRCKVCTHREQCRSVAADRSALKMDGLVQISNANLVLALNDQQEVTGQIKELSTLLEKVKESIVADLGGKPVKAFVQGFGKVYFQSQNRSRFDQKKFEAIYANLNPEVMAKVKELVAQPERLDAGLDEVLARFVDAVAPGKLAPKQPTAPFLTVYPEKAEV